MNFKLEAEDIVNGTPLSGDDKLVDRVAAALKNVEAAALKAGFTIGHEAGLSWTEAGWLAKLEKDLVLLLTGK